MKKLIAIAVLCVASMTFGAAPDYDLIATVGLDDSTTLVNTGDDAISIGTLVFEDYEERITASSAGGMFGSYIGLPDGTREIAFITFGAAAVLQAGESTNLGVINNPMGRNWIQAFVDADPEPVYKFIMFPEPASMSMLALGALALIRRRR